MFGCRAVLHSPTQTSLSMNIRVNSKGQLLDNLTIRVALYATPTPASKKLTTLTSNPTNTTM